jgi:N-acylneuraminate cytidylyltransferase
MISHTLDDALEAETVDRVVVSTDGERIAAAAEAMGVEVIRRPADLATDTATVDAAARHAVEAAQDDAAVIVILYANVPVRPPDLIDQAVRSLAGAGCDSVQSYTGVGKHHPFWMVSLGAEGRVEPHVRSAVYRRQDLPRLYIPDGGVIAVRRDSLFTVVDGEPHAFLGRDRRGIESPEGAVVDVDTAADLAMAQATLLRPLPSSVGSGSG